MRIHLFALLIAAVIVFVVLSPSAQPVEARGLTLEQAVERALQSSPVLAAGKHAVSAAEARVVQAGLLPNPELALEAENFGGGGELDGFDAAESTVIISQSILLGVSAIAAARSPSQNACSPAATSRSRAST